MHIVTLCQARAMRYAIHVLLLLHLLLQVLVHYYYFYYCPAPAHVEV